MNANAARRWLCAALLPAAGAVWASPSYPGVLERELKMPATPPCNVCHLNGVTGLGSPGTAFRTAMQERGLVPMNEGSVKPALDQMREDQVDSDQDGTIDVVELAAFDNPNGPGVLLKSAFEPQYGCGGASSAAAALPLPLWGLGRWCRRRRRSRAAP